MSPLNDRIGSIITVVRPVCDYWQFGIGTSTLSVLVPFSITRHGKSVDPLDIHLLTVEGVDESADSVSIQLSRETRFEIDIRDDVRAGPEAMILHFPHRPDFEC